MAPPEAAPISGKLGDQVQPKLQRAPRGNRLAPAGGGFRIELALVPGISAKMLRLVLVTIVVSLMHP